MASVILDPGLLAFIPSLSKKQLIKRIEILSGWSKTNSTQPWVKIALAPGVQAFLERNALFPSYEPAKALLESTGLRSIYAPEDIIRPLTSLLESAISNEFCCVTDELHQEFVSEPCQPWHGEAVVDEMSQRALILAHVENQAHNDRKLNLFASILESANVAFSARIDAIDPPNAGNYEASNLPLDIEDEFPHVCSFEDVCSALDAQQIWAGATSASQIKFAIQLGCRLHLIAAGRYDEFADIPTFYVGSDFLPSLIRWQAHAVHPFAAKTLESCVAAVLDMPTITIKPFFTKRYRSLDLAAPLRAHLSKKGVGLRLMMWQKPGPKRTIEFANVGGKSEEEITYSDPKDAR